MTEQKKTSRKAALKALEQAYEYYTPLPAGTGKSVPVYSDIGDAA